MVNPFQPGDKVLILRKGVEMEATVRSTWNHEVQVRVADGELLWRTVNTAKLIAQAAPETAPADEEAPPSDTPPETPSVPEVAEEPEPVTEQVHQGPPQPAAEELPASLEPLGHDNGKPDRAKREKRLKKRGKGDSRRDRSSYPF